MTQDTRAKKRVVSRDEWLEARRALLAEEKAFTKQRDALSQRRRELPWVRVETDYVFEGAEGPVRLSELFGDRTQLLVWHFMFGPDWAEGCPSCSFWADGYSGLSAHLAARDTAMVAVSRAPVAKLEAYRERMGWDFRWVSSLGNDFNRDFHVTFTPEATEAGEVYYNYRRTRFPSEEAPGLSVFIRDEDGALHHSYSCYARGLDMLNTAYHLLDLTPKGRDEQDLPWSMAWLRRRDRY